MRSEFMISMSCDSVWRGLEQSLIDDEVDQWQTRLRAYVRASGGHFERTLWLSICFLCTLCFTPCLMQHVIFKECIIKVWNMMFSFSLKDHQGPIYMSLDLDLKSLSSKHISIPWTTWLVTDTAQFAVQRGRCWRDSDDQSCEAGGRRQLRLCR